MESFDKVIVISSNKTDPSFTLASVDNDAANISVEALDNIGEDAETLDRADNSKLSKLKTAELVDSGSSQVGINISTSHPLFLVSFLHFRKRPTMTTFMLTMTTMMSMKTTIHICTTILMKIMTLMAMVWRRLNL